ncbi:flavo protein-like protein [Pterulicium gracile]|uniref:Flavo protein-like protein n=1 Tax=Pterulicium gracile TaxID=1884261 RepID=A0A5C3QEC6_9AGAR|nr:flavo protein-like protein [Pterula gracilis]
MMIVIRMSAREYRHYLPLLITHPRIPETLPEEVLTKMHAPPKPPFPIIKPEQLTEYDAFVFGIPTHYGNFPAQWKAFWDATGKLWASGALVGKYVGTFVSTATPGGGQESTVISALSTFVHHGMIFVPVGYGEAMDLFSTFDEVRGGSPWGAGTFAAGDGSRQPTKLELELATYEGKHFYERRGVTLLVLELRHQIIQGSSCITQFRREPRPLFVQARRHRVQSLTTMDQFLKYVRHNFTQSPESELRVRLLVQKWEEEPAMTIALWWPRFGAADSVNLVSQG